MFTLFRLCKWFHFSCIVFSLKRFFFICLVFITNWTQTLSKLHRSFRMLTHTRYYIYFIFLKSLQVFCSNLKWLLSRPATQLSLRLLFNIMLDINIFLLIWTLCPESQNTSFWFTSSFDAMYLAVVSWEREYRQQIFWDPEC